MAFKLDLDDATIARLYALPDRWLAQSLLNLSRAARREAPDLLGDPCRNDYDANMVWQIVPILAKRLGATAVEPNEATDPWLLTADDRALREISGAYLANCGMGITAHRIRKDFSSSRPMALDILGNDIANGNPVAFAVDRLCGPAPADDDRGDHIARTMREVSRCRFRHCGFDRWTPSFQDYPSRHGFRQEKSADHEPETPSPR